MDSGVRREKQAIRCCAWRPAAGKLPTLGPIVLELDGVALETGEGPATVHLLIDRGSTLCLAFGALHVDDVEGVVEIVASAVTKVRAQHGPTAQIVVVHDGAPPYCDEAFVAALKRVDVTVTAARRTGELVTSCVERAEWDMRQSMGT